MFKSKSFDIDFCVIPLTVSNHALNVETTLIF